MDRREETIGFRVRRLSNMIRRTMDESSTKKYADEMTGVHGWVLGYLFKHEAEGREVYQRDLEQDFGIRRSTVTKLLQLMERNGLIVRLSVQQDARLKRLVLTQRGKELHLSVVRDIEDMERRMKRNISQQELDAFFATMDKIMHNLDGDGEAGPENGGKLRKN